MPSHPSRQAPGEPGRQKMKVAPAVPAVARLWIVDAPILAWLSIWKAMEKPSMRFSNSGFTASGVTSRPVKPVPPVVMTTSTPASAIQLSTLARICVRSSVTISRFTSAWPASRIISSSTSPDLSVALSRVSETVSVAMRSGLKVKLSSILAMSFSSLFQRRFDGKQVAPSHAFGGRRAQEIGGMERRHRLRLVTACFQLAPLASDAHDAVGDVEQLFRGGAAERQDDLWCDE